MELFFLSFFRAHSPVVYSTNELSPQTQGSVMTLLFLVPLFSTYFSLPGVTVHSLGIAHYIIRPLVRRSTCIHHLFWLLKL